MSFLHKLLASILVLNPLLTAVPVTAQAAVFSDVSVSTSSHVAIESLVNDGLISGNPDGTFKPLNRINRAEFLKLVLLASHTQNEIDAAGASASVKKFPDVDGNAWYANFVYFASANGIVAGYPDGTFKPEQQISFVEASKILSLAYKQNMNGGGSEWYEPYVLALESSKAIPTSIDTFDRKITRAETAEMLWRLVDSKTDQPTKGFLNIKDPSVKINTALDTVQLASSCRDLQAYATQAQNGQSTMYYRGGGGMMLMEDAAQGAMPPMAPQATKSLNSQTGNGADGDYSQTNVQVAGVDEADIVKTDGTNLYIVRNNEKSKVTIVRAQPGSDLKELASISFDDKGMLAQELYVEGKTLIVIGQRGYTYGGGPVIMEKRMMNPGIAVGEYYPGMQYKNRTDVQLYDVSDPSKPKLQRTLSFDGNQLSSRRIGSKLYLVLQDPFYYGGPIPLSATEKDLVPQFEDSKTGKTISVAPCNKISIIPHIWAPQYMTVAVIPTQDAKAEVKTTAVLGSAENIYSSLNNLYLSSTQWNYQWAMPVDLNGGAASTESRVPSETTHLYRFAFTDAGVELKAQGDVPGHILNQFSMDERGQNFRVATTVSSNWSGSSETHSTNNLYVLNMNLEQAGSVNDIAPGETIYATRFMGDRAYMVTFKTVDPFFVIDLKDPRAPKILGQLKIPGFSKYLEPYDENHVIGFGNDVDASIDADKIHGSDAVYYTAIQGLKLSLFDVTNVSNPTELHQTIIGDRGTTSPVLENHKALLFEKDRNLLSFPVLVTKRPAGSLKSADAPPVFQGAYVYDISLSKGFQLRGTISHYDDPSVFTKAGDYWYNGGSDVERIVRIGKSLLTISQSGVRSNNESTVASEGKMTFGK